MGRIYSLESVRNGSFRDDFRGYAARVEKKIRRLALRGATVKDAYLLYEAICGDRWNNGQAYHWYRKWISGIDEIISNLSCRKMSRLKYDNFLTCWGIREKYYDLIGRYPMSFMVGCGHGWFYDDRRAPVELKGLKTELADIFCILRPILTEDGIWGFRDTGKGEVYTQNFTFRAWENISGFIGRATAARSVELSRVLSEYLQKKRKRFRNQSEIQIPGFRRGVALMDEHWRYEFHSESQE